MKKLFSIFVFCCMLFAEDVDSAKNSTSSNLNIEIQNSKEAKIYSKQVRKQLENLWVAQDIRVGGSVLVRVRLSADGEVIDYGTDDAEGDEIFRQKIKDFLAELSKQRFAKAPDNKPHEFLVSLVYKIKSDQIKEKR